MRLGLLITFWILYYIPAFIISLFLISVSFILQIDYLGVFSFVIIPCLAVLFSWLYFRKIYLLSRSFIISIGLFWIALAFVVDIVVGYLFFRTNPIEIVNVLSFVGYGLVFIAVMFAGYLAYKHTTPAEMPEVNFVDEVK